MLEEEFDCRLTFDASPGLVEELETASASAPLRERLHAQLMLALDASGRRADALHEYDRIRHRLSEELGIDPGPLLREAHRAVLTEERDERRILVARSRISATRMGHRTILIAAGVTAAALVATAGVLLANGGRGQARATLRTHAGELVIATPNLRSVRAEIPLSGTIINEQPGGLVSADGSLWAVTEQGTVTQVDLARGRVVGSTPLALPTGPGGMAVGLGATWVTDSGSATLYRLLPGVTAARQITLPPLKNTRGLGTGASPSPAGRSGSSAKRGRSTVSRLRDSSNIASASPMRRSSWAKGAVSGSSRAIEASSLSSMRVATGC